MPNLYSIYKEKVTPELKKKFAFKSVMAVPRIKKTVVNVGVGRTLKDPKLLEMILASVKSITGQQPIKTLAKKSIAGFKIRENQVVGVMVTLRGPRMFDFLEKLVRIALPRVRDFKGLSKKSFDGHGNYSIGFKEQIVFPEASSANVDQTFGLEINIQTNAKNDEQALELLTALGFPFKK